jgi:hypothetical protein
VTQRVSQLPFLRGGVNVTGEIIGVTMECLNAEPTRTLAVSTPHDTLAGSVTPGLDLCLEERLRVSGKTVVPVIAEVLCSAGITEMTEVIDRQMHRPRRAIRLLQPWAWHIASTLAPSVRLGGGADGSSLSWMDLCPVCRTGILSKIVGKQLFGIPRTDFIIECSHCGAKFIPVGPAYRLVSIAHIRDPLWKKHLDKTCLPEEWAALARSTAPKGSAATPARMAERKPAASLPPSSVTFPAMKDGSLAVPVPGKTIYFRPVPLKFAGSTKGDAFFRVQKTLGELLEHPAFHHLREPVNSKYSRYLPLKAGLFLSQLKERHDPFYREFLNPYGDERYGTVMAENSGDAGKRGVLIVAVNRGLYHVLDSPDPAGTTISSRFGRTGPEDCLLSGDPERCRVNALLCTNRETAGLYIWPAEKEADRREVIDAIRALTTPGQAVRSS